MQIGLRAFMVIADSLQQRESEPSFAATLPSTSASAANANSAGSGTGARRLIASTLTESIAQSIGIQKHLMQVQRTLDALIRALDAQVGRGSLLSSGSSRTDSADVKGDAERKPKLDLLKTCVAAIPRLIPDPMSKLELCELLARYTIHSDEELRCIALQTLHTFMLEHVFWRQPCVQSFIQFLRELPESTSPQLFDKSLGVLLQLLSHWRLGLQRQAEARAAPAHPNSQHSASGWPPQRGPPASVAAPQKAPTPPAASTSSLSTSTSSSTASAASGSAASGSAASGQLRLSRAERHTLHAAEGFALATLCVCRSSARHVAVLVLKEVRNIALAVSAADPEPDRIRVR